MKSTDVALRMEGVTVAPRERPPLQGFTAVFRAGVVYGLTGANGAGASTVAGVIAGDLGDYEGAVFVNDEPVTLRDQPTARDLGLGVVRQSLTLIPSFSILDNVLLSMGNVRPSRAARDAMFAKLEEIVDLYQIPVDLGASLEGMGGASQQWVDILRVLAMDPAVVVFDQSEVRLGPDNRKQYLQIVSSLAEQERAVIVISHDQAMMREVCQEVLVLEQGATAEVRTRLEELELPVFARSQAGEGDGAGVGDGPVSTLFLEDFGGEGGATYDIAIPGGQIVGVSGHPAKERNRFVAALGGARKVQGQVRIDDQIVDLSGVLSARAAGIQYVAPDEAKIGPIEPRKLSALFTGDKDSLFGRLVARKDRQLGPIEHLELINDLLASKSIAPVRVIVVDRPTLGMDEDGSQRVFQLLRGFADRGVLVVLSTDSPTELSQWCDSVLNI